MRAAAGRRGSEASPRAASLTRPPAPRGHTPRCSDASRGGFGRAVREGRARSGAGGPAAAASVSRSAGAADPCAAPRAERGRGPSAVAAPGDFPPQLLAPLPGSFSGALRLLSSPTSQTHRAPYPAAGGFPPGAQRRGDTDGKVLGQHHLSPRGALARQNPARLLARVPVAAGCRRRSLVRLTHRKAALPARCVKGQGFSFFLIGSFALKTGLKGLHCMGA